MCNNNNCEKNIKEALDEKDLKFFLDGYVDEYEEDVVTLPRDEYAELVAESTILRVVERLVESDLPSYTMIDVLKFVLSLGDEDMIEPKAEAPDESETNKEDDE